jgi:hypothetical protein
MKTRQRRRPFLTAATASVPSLGVVVRRVMTDNNCRYKASISTTPAEFSLQRVPDRASSPQTNDPTAQSRPLAPVSTLCSASDLKAPHGFRLMLVPTEPFPLRVLTTDPPRTTALSAARMG